MTDTTSINDLPISPQTDSGAVANTATNTAVNTAVNTPENITLNTNEKIRL